MAGLRKYDHDAVLNLRAQGLGPTAIANRTGMSPGTVQGVITDARRRGDVRAQCPVMAGAAESAEQPRPNVLVVHVPTTDGVNGQGRTMPVSLPRLKFLAGWAGREA